MRILSGIQPTGEKHIGNYIGAIRHYVSNQELGDAYYFVADLHALTVQPDPAELETATLRTAAILLAAGIDPERSTLFVQSHVAAQHTELTWYLSCVATFGELSRMTQFKDKSDGKSDSVSIGLFSYPVLQAADILAYDIDQVPVGADQKQHLELARNIAQRFNNRYGETFVVPEPRIAKTGGRVMDLQDPTCKMSTSAGSEKGTVLLLDEPAKMLKKFKSAVTDSDNEVRFDRENKAGISNLLELMHIATDREIADLESEYGDAGYGAFKTAAAEAVIEYVAPVRERFNELIADPAELQRLLAIGAQRAAEQASKRLAVVRERIGLR